jgi:exopolysaccharide production protein ExoZ
MSEAKSQNTGKFELIEAWRGLAASAVVLYHIARHLDKNGGAPGLRQILQFGHAGVDLFFVLSGFVILYVHYHDIGRPNRLSHYIGRRFTRVMPTYWVALTMTIAMGAAGSSGLPSFADMAWSYSLLPTYSEPILGVAWTLQHELVFYAIFAVLVLNRMAGSILMTLWLTAIALAEIGVRPFVGLPSPILSFYNLEFFFGLAAAYYLRNYTLPAPRTFLCIGAALFAASAIAENLRILDGYGSLARICYGLPSLLLVLAGAELGRGGGVRVPEIGRILGAASYSIYLFQFVFIGIFWQLMIGLKVSAALPGAVIFCVLSVGTILGCIATSKFIEHPLTRLIRADKRPSPVQAPDSVSTR